MGTEKLLGEEETLDGEQFIVCHTQSTHLLFFYLKHPFKPTRLAAEAALDTAMSRKVPFNMEE